MKNKILLLLCVIPALSWSSEEDPSFYAKIWSGAHWLQNTSLDHNRASYKTGFLVSGSLGYRFCSDFRVEAEYAYRRNAISKIDFFAEGDSRSGHFKTSSYMANLFWDLPYCEFFNPFVGAGIGYDSQKMHASNDRVIFDQKWHHFSWQVMTGLSYPLLCNTDLVVEYQYHQGGCHFKNHAIGLGLVYSFDGMIPSIW